MDIGKIVKGAKLRVSVDEMVIYRAGGTIAGKRFHKGAILFCGVPLGNGDIELRSDGDEHLYHAGKEFLAARVDQAK